MDLAEPAAITALQDRDWEALWAPYDESVYETACGLLDGNDVVVDIGAGDLRFARRVAPRVQWVFAVERNPVVLEAGLAQGALPPNVSVVRADALAYSIPRGATAGVLLMRHCRHLKDYITRLRVAGCRRLITNARWGMDVECIPLAPQSSFAQARNGWYGCMCGAVGFKAKTPDDIDPVALNALSSVEDCPACARGASPSPVFHRSRL